MLRDAFLVGKSFAGKIIIAPLGMTPRNGPHNPENPGKKHFFRIMNPKD
jgi:hypothetical protein